MGVRIEKGGREASSAFHSLDDKRSQQKGVQLGSDAAYSCGGCFFCLSFGVLTSDGN